MYSTILHCHLEGLAVFYFKEFESFVAQIRITYNGEEDVRIDKENQVKVPIESTYEKPNFHLKTRNLLKG